MTNTEIPGVSEALDTPMATSSTPAAASDAPATGTRRRSTNSGGGLEGKVLAELQQLAGGLGIKGAGRMRKSQLIDAIRAAQSGSAAQGSDTAGTADENSGQKQGAGKNSGPKKAGGQGGANASATTASASGADAGENTSRQRRRAERPQAAANGAHDAQVGEGDSDATHGNADDDRRGGSNSSGSDEGQHNRQRRDDRRDDDDDRGGNRNRRRRRDRRGGSGGGGGANRERRPRDQEPDVRDDDVLIPVAGILDILDNYAFVRTSGYSSGSDDVYVSLAMVRRYGLRKGDAVAGVVRQPREGEKQQKFNALVRVDSVNGTDPEVAKKRPDFMKLTPLYPQDRLRMETEPGQIATRIIDLFAPIGKGQRGLILSPPKAGKTMMMQAIAHAITENNPEVHLMVVLVEERPEEVTDFQRSVKGEVIASTFDRHPSDHTALAELAIERAKRLVELGHDVVVLADGITRLGRAYNMASPGSGRLLSGGIDASALYPPKKFFGAARNIEDGGSLTILATALVETGSKMDEVIFEEFKGTGNMELRLRRDLAEKRIFPAIDVDATSTRREEILVSREELSVMWKLRRVVSALEPQAAMELMLDRLKKSKSNAEFLMSVQQSTPSVGNGSSDDD